MLLVCCVWELEMGTLNVNWAWLLPASEDVLMLQVFGTRRRNPTCHRGREDILCPIGINQHSHIPWDLQTRSILKEAEQGGRRAMGKEPTPEPGWPQAPAQLGSSRSIELSCKPSVVAAFPIPRRALCFCKCFPEKQQHPTQENITATSGLFWGKHKGKKEIWCDVISWIRIQREV